MNNSKPLAARVRPKNLKTFVGQQHLLGPGKPLREAIDSGHCHSMVLWGPPGCGKTTLAKILAEAAGAAIESLSAVMAGVKDIRAVISRAQGRLQNGQSTILFIDEIHRFNKSQQDALLPFVEDGTVTLIGATTENPSFEINNALLSRARVYVLQRMTDQDCQKILADALLTLDPAQNVSLAEDGKATLIALADGDARRLLNLLETLVEFASAHGLCAIDNAFIESYLPQTLKQFDKQGEAFYDLISALHKSVRGSAPDAALYWLARLLVGGCDPLYVARRVVRMASEDIGNADPRALALALDAWEVQERLGSPEGELALAQAILYLASAAKSNAVYRAFSSAVRSVNKNGSYPVPLYLRNAPTKLMKSLDFGKGYRYAHDEPDAFARGETYFPEEMREEQYYFPVERGLEIKIKEKLDWLRRQNKEKTC